jgi:hypothetical protein
MISAFHSHEIIMQVIVVALTDPLAPRIVNLVDASGLTTRTIFVTLICGPVLQKLEAIAHRTSTSHGGCDLGVSVDSSDVRGCHVSPVVRKSRALNLRLTHCHHAPLEVGGLPVIVVAVMAVVVAFTAVLFVIGTAVFATRASLSACPASHHASAPAFVPIG